MKISDKIIVAENAAINDSAFGKTISIDNLFKGADILAKLPAVEKIEITRFSDMIITLKDLPGKIQITNLNGAVIYRSGCKPKHVKFVSTEFPKILAFNNINIF